jgi:hypothetical protein
MKLRQGWATRGCGRTSDEKIMAGTRPQPPANLKDNNLQRRPFTVSQLHGIHLPCKAYANPGILPIFHDRLWLRSKGIKIRHKRNTTGLATGPV